MEDLAHPENNGEIERKKGNCIQSGPSKVSYLAPPLVIFGAPILACKILNTSEAQKTSTSGIRNDYF